MKSSHHPSTLDQLIQLMGRLPGLGPRSAQRIVLKMLAHPHELLHPLISSLQSTAQNIQTCHLCGNLDDTNPCSICTHPNRDRQIVCIVEHVCDLWALEKTHAFKGHYHILGGTLCAINGVGPEELHINTLIKRIEDHGIKEIIFATNATVEGQTTVHYLMNQLQSYDISMSKLARGIPLGGELNYLDEGTLITALNSRENMS